MTLLDGRVLSIMQHRADWQIGTLVLIDVYVHKNPLVSDLGGKHADWPVPER